MHHQLVAISDKEKKSEILKIKLAEKYPSSVPQEARRPMSRKIMSGLDTEKKPLAVEFIPLSKKAIADESTDEIDRLFKTNAFFSLAKIAFEIGSFKVICYVMDKILKLGYMTILKDDIFEAARLRSEDLYIYLTMEFRGLLEKAFSGRPPMHLLYGIVATVTSSYSSTTTKHRYNIGFQYALEVISEHPEVINMNLREDKGNTLLFEYITENRTDKVKLLMSAIFEAAFLCESVNFDIERKNNSGQTALDLALANYKATQNKDIVVTMLLFGNPVYTNHEKDMHEANINIAAINQERTALTQKIIQKIAHMSLTNNVVLMETNYNLAVMAHKYDQLEAENVQIRLALERTRQEMGCYRETLQLVCKHLGLVQPQPATIPQIAMTSANPLLQLTSQSSAVPNLHALFTAPGVGSLGSDGVLMKREYKY